MTYDGKEHSVSGFTCAPDGADFSAVTVGAKGTNVGAYDAKFAENTVGTVDATAKYYLAGCWPLLLVGAIGSFPVVSHVGTNLLRRSKAWQAFSVVLFLALLLLCIALMMNDTYSTFLYFQF